MRSIKLATAMAILLLGCSGGAPFGTVEIGDLTVDGEVDPDYLFLQLGQLDPRFEACYVRALRKNRTAEGVIEIHILGNDGSLKPEVTANQTQSESLADCVTEAISGLTIVQPTGTAPWDYVGDWSVEFEIVSKK
jgi:hypothetical protein